MDKPIRMRKRLVWSGHSRAVILPAFFLGDNCDEVYLEISDHHAVIRPIRKKRK